MFHRSKMAGPLLISLVLVTGLLGCSDGEEAVDQSASSFTDTPSSPAYTPEPEPVEPVGLTPSFLTYSVSGRNEEEVAITGTVKIDPTLRPASEVATDPDWGPVLANCDFDPKRDATMLASIRLEAESGGFEVSGGASVLFADAQGELPKVYETNAWTGSGLGGIKSAVAYTEPECYGAQTPSFGVAAKFPASDSQRATWGPVNTVVVIPGFYGPARPKGDKKVAALFSHILVGVGDHSNFYDRADGDAFVIYKGEATGPGAGPKTEDGVTVFSLPIQLNGS